LHPDELAWRVKFGLSQYDYQPRKKLQSLTVPEFHPVLNILTDAEVISLTDGVPVWSKTETARDQSKIGGRHEE
jgi:hypothetical protein